MCALIALFNLHAQMPLLQLWGELAPSTAEFCTFVCSNYTHNYTSVNGADCDGLCDDLTKALDDTLLKPSQLQGGLNLVLRLHGLTSMYVFCIAVVLSLSCSVFIEYLDDKISARRMGVHSPRFHAHSYSHSRREGNSSSSRSVRLLHEGPHQEFGGDGRAKLLYPPSERKRAVSHGLLVLVQLCLTCAAFSYPLFRRRVEGSIAHALRDHGFDFDGQYSLLDMGILSGQAGGWDNIMAITFWVFIIIAPVFRAMSQLCLLLLPMRRCSFVLLHRVSRYISYYYAIEVMLVAIPLLQVAFKPLSANILSASNFAPCGVLEKKYPDNDGLCFALDVQPTSGYFFSVAAVIVFLLSGFDGSPTHKFIHRHLYPNDAPPPNWAACAGLVARQCRPKRSS